MINNRQNGRRRGRNGQPQRNGAPGGPDRGSRVDNRARGNAAQLLEKYKSLARDAQMQGDRVNTEYYLQFADHYFRVLSENRSRFEEQRPPRRDDYRDEMDGDGGDGQRYEGANASQTNGSWDDDERDGDGEFGQQEPEQRRAEPRRDRAPRPEQANGNGNASARPRQDGADRAPRREEAEREPRQETVVQPQRNDEDRVPERRPRRTARPTTPPAEVAESAQPDLPERIEIDRLPQGFGTTAEAGPVDEAPRPRRRAPRRARTEAGAGETDTAEA